MGVIDAIGRGHLRQVEADETVIHQHNGARAALRLGGLALAAATITGSRLGLGRFQTPLAIAGGVAGVLLGASSLFVGPSTGTIVHRGDRGLDDALWAASSLGKSAAVVARGGGQFDVVDVSRHYDLDHRDLDRLRIGDGTSIHPTRLVTEDGDVLEPLSAESTQGYRNVGALKPTQLTGLDPSNPDDVEAALRGVQLGSARNHDRLLVGEMIGDRNGYASSRQAADDIMTVGGPEFATLKVGSGAQARWFAFALEGPPRWSVATRGTGVAPLRDVRIGADKALWKGTGVAQGLGFAERVLPFHPLDPIGTNVAVARARRTPAEYLGSFDSGNEAARAAAHLGQDGVGFRRIDTPGFMTIEAPSEYGRFHLYAQSSLTSANGARPLEPELARGHTLQYRDRDTRTRRLHGFDGYWSISERRDELYQRHAQRRDDLLGRTMWRETSRVWHTR